MKWASVVSTVASRARSAHAGCSLAEGKLLDGSIVECDCHGSRYEMATGHLKRGPSVYDQPAYEVRRIEAGGWEARRRA